MELIKWRKTHREWFITSMIPLVSMRKVEAEEFACIHFKILKSKVDTFHLITYPCSYSISTFSSVVVFFFFILSSLWLHYMVWEIVVWLPFAWRIAKETEIVLPQISYLMNLHRCSVAWFASRHRLRRRRRRQQQWHSVHCQIVSSDAISLSSYVSWINSRFSNSLPLYRFFWCGLLYVNTKMCQITSSKL